MDNTNNYQAGRALRALDTAIRLARYLLIFVTVLAAATLLVALSGRGTTLSVAADLDEPFVIELDDGRRVGINDGRITTYENFDLGRERNSLADVGEVGLTVTVSRTDTDSRIVLGTMIVGWLAAAWLGLNSLARLVAAARIGRVFTNDSPRRLRHLGIALVAVPVITVVGSAILDQTIDTDIPISIALSGTSGWVLVLVGVAMFALAEVFVEAARLREFEEATV